MKKVRYRTERSLGPLATPEQLVIVNEAFQAGRVRIDGKANRHLNGVWFMSPDQFVDAIRSHLRMGCRLFRKFEKGTSVLLPNALEASIWIRVPDDDDDYDDGTVYVELIIRRDEVILIFDAHEHEEGKLRLPP